MVRQAALVLFIPSSILLYGQTIPPESSPATAVQRLGFNDITVSYHRPNVKGRAIWGTLVPYGEVWRTGADYPTRITLKDTTRVNGVHSILPGRYAVYTIPSDGEWTMIFSRNTELWGAFGYSPKDDALRFTVTPVTTEFMETFTILFSDVTEESATLELRWERIALKVKLEVNCYDRILKAVGDAYSTGVDDWGIYWKGARYLHSKGRDLQLARKWIDRSISLDTSWVNLWQKALIEATLGNVNEAIEWANKAKEICIKNTPYCPYTKTYTDQISAWKMK